MLRKYSSDNKLESRAIIQRDLGGLDEWDQQEYYEIQQVQCCAYDKKSLQPYGLQVSFPEKALEFMVYSNLNVSSKEGQQLPEIY